MSTLNVPKSASMDPGQDFTDALNRKVARFCSQRWRPPRL